MDAPLGCWKAYKEKAKQGLHNNAMGHIEQILEATSHKAAAAWPPTSHLQNYLNKTVDMWDAAEEVRRNS